MAYCTTQDVERAAGGADRLAALADWDRDGAADASVLTDAIAQVEAWINSYAKAKRRVPFSPVPEIIRWTCAREVIYRLKADRGMAAESDEQQHEERQGWLRDLAVGRVTVGVDPDTASSSSNAPDADMREGDVELLRREDLIGSW